MQERSMVERSIKESTLVRSTLNDEEQKVYNKVKRSLVRTYVNPNYAVRMLIDLSALEYLRYISEKSSRTARSVMDLLSELDLTPKSKKSSEVSKTLSQIFQTIADDKDDAPVQSDVMVSDVVYDEHGDDIEVLPSGNVGDII